MMAQLSPERPLRFVAWLYANRWAFLYRVAVSILLLAWLKLFPRYILTLYLGHYGIPPFELVGDDLPGAHVVLVWTLILLVIGGLYLWLPFILLVLRTFYFKAPDAGSGQEEQASVAAQVVRSKALRRFAAFMSTFLIALILLMMFGAGRMEWSRLFYFALLSFVLVLSVFLFFRRNLSESAVNWRGPLIFVFLSIMVPISAEPAVITTLDAAFRKFRVGGGLPVRVERFGETTVGVSGRLRLLGKRNIYIEQGEGKSRTLAVVANAENLVVTIEAEKPNED